MSTGRHAAKRAAKANEDLANEQKTLLAQEENAKSVRNKDIEAQRIAITRARFGGQTPETAGQNESKDPNPALDQGKSSTPNSLKTRSPVKNTIMSMYLDNTPQGQQPNSFITG